MTSEANQQKIPTEVTDPSVPRWVKILRWVNIVALVLYVGMAVVTFVGASVSTASLSDPAFGMSILLVAPVLIVARLAPIVGIVIVLLILGTSLLVRYRRRGMTLGQAVSSYTLLAWTTLWTATWLGVLCWMLVGTYG